MTTKLKAVAPKSAEPSKPKVLCYGAAGVGKTWWALDFPKVYYIDTEGGADLSHYTDKLEKAGGVYFGPEQGALDPESVIGQFMALATEKHEYKTVVIDSGSKLWNSIIAREAERLGEKDAFGASKKPAIAFFRRLISWIDRIDMNVILTAHSRPTWLGDKQGPPTFDCYEKLSYELNLIMEVIKQGPERVGMVRKSRLLQFPEGAAIEWTEAEFAKRYGAECIQREPKVVEISTADQVEELKRLAEVLKIEPIEQTKLLERARSTTFEEMPRDKADQLITFWQNKASGAKK